MARRVAFLAVPADLLECIGTANQAKLIAIRTRAASRTKIGTKAGHYPLRN